MGILQLGFKNVKQGNQITGFQVPLVNSYYRGTYVSLTEGFDVTVDGETFPRDKVTCNFGSTTLKQDQLEGSKERWQYLEPVILTVSKPGGLKPGLHDINISYEEMVNLIGEEDAEKIKNLCLKIYNEGAEYARKKGIIIADTKFEFGKIDDEIILVDEVLTPDSSRFWPADLYTPGESQPSFDKQYVRDYLSSTGWDKNSSPPNLPDEVVEETQRKYQEAYEKLTGKKFDY